MKTLLDRTLAALDRGEGVMWVSILESSGSTPRGTGAKMAVFADGSICGTIGGGAVEMEAIGLSATLLQEKRCCRKSFLLTPNQVADIGMICGGQVELYFLCLTPEDSLLRPLLTDLRQRLSGEDDLWLLMKLQGDRLLSFGFYSAAHGLHSSQSMEKGEWEPLLKRKAVWLCSDCDYYAEPLLKRGKLYIFGAGHVSRALAPVLAKLNFRMVLYDSRESLAKAEYFPHVEQIVLGSFEEIGQKLSLGPRDYAIVMTPGHEADFEVLRQLLDKELCYLGCIGSRKKVEKTRQRLEEEGFSPAQIHSIHSPIGLPILAETPEEIAISIAAELIEHRAKHNG